MNQDDEPTVVAGLDSGRTQAMSWGEATQMGAPVECPVCHARNVQTETYCADCGFLLSGTLGDEGEKPSAGPPATLQDTRSRQVFPLWPGVNTVGRENTDVLLSDPSISRHHAGIEAREDGVVIVTDSGSTNGTVVAGQRLEAGEPAELGDGDEVRFGNSILVLKIARQSEDEAEEAAQEDAAEPAEAQGETEPQDESESSEADVAAEDAEEPESVEQDQDEIEEEDVHSAAASGAPHLEGIDDLSLRFEIAPDGATIGRRDGHDIVLKDSYVSSSHAQIAVEDGVCKLTDTGSTNGTAINGNRIPPQVPHALSDGDEISFGPVKLRFVISGGDEL